MSGWHSSTLLHHSPRLSRQTVAVRQSAGLDETTLTVSMSAAFLHCRMVNSSSILFWHLESVMVVGSLKQLYLLFCSNSGSCDYVYVKWVTHSEEPTENYFPNLQFPTALQSFIVISRSVFWFCTLQLQLHYSAPNSKKTKLAMSWWSGGSILELKATACKFYLIFFLVWKYSKVYCGEVFVTSPVKSDSQSSLQQCRFIGF